jgi:uncharacterized membrane protein YccC
VRDWLARQDPGGIGLRRGVRAAIAVPVSVFITMNVLGDATAASFAGFGSVGLLMTADYAGSARQRTVDYLGTGVVVTCLIPLGLLLSGNPVTAALGTFVIAFLTYLAGMVRGNIAVGAPAALLLYIVTVCLGTRQTTVADALLAWWVAVIVCTVVALVVLPRRRQDIARKLLAEVLERSADMAHATWLEPLDPVTVRDISAALDDSLERLRGVHAGKPFRPSGVTHEDRALSLLIDHVWGMREVVRDPNLQQRPTEGTGPAVDAARLLAQQIVSTQRQNAAALRSSGQIPTIDGIVAARDAFREAEVSAVLEMSRHGASPMQVAEDLANRHIISIAAVIVEQTAQLVREVTHHRIEVVQGGLSVPQRPLTVFVRSQLTLDSGWLRNAVRGALGLALAMVVVSVTNIQNGFWVLLGVIAVLRFDSFTTRRNAWQAILGTVVGVIAASGIIVVTGGNLVVMWTLLPIVVFLAGWSAVALKYPIAQASFTGFVLIMIAITRWPPNLLTGTSRIVDIALGATIAVIVAVIIWPHGALGALHKAMAGSIVTAWSLAALVLRSFTTKTDPRMVDEALDKARRAILVGSEAYDVALMQRGPGMPRVAGWLALTGDSYLLVNIARTLLPFSGQLPAAWSPSLTALVEQGAAAGDAYWTSVAISVGQGAITAPIPSPPTTDWSVLKESPTTRNEALGFLITVWFLDWFDRIDGIRAGARAPDATTVVRA